MMFSQILTSATPIVCYINIVSQGSTDKKPLIFLSTKMY